MLLVVDNELNNGFYWRITRIRTSLKIPLIGNESIGEINQWVKQRKKRGNPRKCQSVIWNAGIARGSPSWSMFYTRESPAIENSIFIIRAVSQNRQAVTCSQYKASHADMHLSTATTLLISIPLFGHPFTFVANKQFHYNAVIMSMMAS